MSKINVKGLSKVFGADPDAALQMLSDGASKEEILKETGQTVGVQSLDFTVEEGEIFVVMGLSGSGKSTLIRMLNRLIPASSGQVEIEGTDVMTADEATLRDLRLRRLAMVFQHFALFPHRTVRENVEYGLKIAGVPSADRRERAMTALTRVGLEPWAERRPSALSGGMQQRVGLARALAVDPEILLMDEPFSALDPLIRRDMQDELLELQRELKKTIVFITHDLLEALVLGDRIAIMKDGEFVQVGTAEEIVGQPADDYVAAFTQDIDRSRVFSVDKVTERAVTLDLASDTVASARKSLRAADAGALLVTDGARIAGAVTHRSIAEASDSAGLGEVLETGVPETETGTPLYKLFGLCRRGLPIAVRDANGKLAGIARPEAIFDALDAGEGEPALAAE